jgi:sugar ABC transporter permease
MTSANKQRLKKIAVAVFRYAFLFGLIFTILYPQLTKIAVAFRSDADLMDTSIVFLPKHFVFDAFLEAAEALNYWPTFFRTVLLCAAASLLHVAACTMTAYSIAKFDYFGKKIVYVAVLLTFFIPPSLISLPMYTSFQSFDIFGIFQAVTGQPLQLLDNPVSLLLLYGTANGLKSGLFVNLLVQYFKNFPKVLDEAAEVDGASNLKILLSIALPSAKVMLVTVFLFTFVWQYTDTFYTSMFFTTFKVMSSALSSVGATFAQMAQEGGMTFIKVSQMTSAGSILFALPLILLYAVCNKVFVQGIERSGIVG